MSGQFERLIRLEDEELESSEWDDSNLSSAKDSCQVPMMSINNNVDTSNLATIYRDTKLNQAYGNLPGVSFIINGRHIQMSASQLKYVSLITLTIQNAALSLTMRAAKTQKEQFSTSMAVTLAEFLKLLTCMALLWYEEKTMKGALNSVKMNIVHNYLDTLKVAIPSFVYYVQNNLLYVGSTHLDAATSQVTYQLKILTTAIFSVLMLNKKLSKTQWVALFALFIGVAMIETVSVGGHKPDKLGTIHYTNQSFERESHTDAQTPHDKPMLGFVAILVACCLSGFAGVYFEKILKGSAQVSLWIRNIQLSVVAIPIGLIQVLMTEHELISTKGVFYGFTPLTWLCILLQAQGGLLVAVVVKFANNILKGFATSMAILISTIASIFLFNFNLTPTFGIGTSLVIGSVMMYNKQ